MNVVVMMLDKEPTLARDLHRRLWDFQRVWSGSLAWRDEPAK